MLYFPVFSRQAGTRAGLVSIKYMYTDEDTYSSGFPEGSRAAGGPQEGWWKAAAETAGAHLSQYDDPDETAGGRVLRDVEQLGQVPYCW